MHALRATLNATNNADTYTIADVGTTDTAADRHEVRRRRRLVGMVQHVLSMPLEHALALQSTSSDGSEDLCEN